MPLARRVAESGQVLTLLYMTSEDVVYLFVKITIRMLIVGG